MKISQRNFQRHVKVSSGSMKLNEQGYKMIGVHNKLLAKKERKKQYTHVSILDDVFFFILSRLKLIFFLQHLHLSFIC